MTLKITTIDLGWICSGHGSGIVVELNLSTAKNVQRQLSHSPWKRQKPVTRDQGILKYQLQE
jgi:hypothetical protein